MFYARNHVGLDQARTLVKHVRNAQRQIGVPRGGLSDSRIHNIVSFHPWQRLPRQRYLEVTVLIRLCGHDPRTSCCHIHQDNWCFCFQPPGHETHHHV